MLWPRPADLVDRQLPPPAFDELLVADIKATRRGMTLR